MNPFVTVLDFPCHMTLATLAEVSPECRSVVVVLVVVVAVAAADGHHG